MLSVLSLIALVPLAISAARIPHHLLDASLVSDTTSNLGLHLGPRSPEPFILDDLIDNIPIVGPIVNDILPEIQLGTSFCVTLAAALDVRDNNGVLLNHFDAGVCLCVDAEVSTGSMSANVEVVASTGITIGGQRARAIRNAILRAKYGIGQANPNIVVSAASNICLQLNLFVGFTEHDFSNPSSVGGCCARRCTAPYIPGPGNSCVCPTANKCGDQCLTGPALVCDGTCKLASEFTCKSGTPVPIENIPVPRRRALPYGRCDYGQELCPVASSSGWECVNTKTDMESCGGCVHAFGSAGNRGQDCTSIPFIDEVSCDYGRCIVKSCERGYTTGNNGTSCILDTRADLRGSSALRVQTLLK